MGGAVLRLLADTEAVIRFAIDDLPAAARRVMTDQQSEVFVSAASVWELATKVRIGKLNLPDVTRTKGIARWIVEDGFSLLPIRADHAELAGSMVIDHRDPWDRMILAQAQIEDFIIISSDPVFARNARDAIWS
ncbi:MAG: type II toxin-antitoxin system VapC family toxin [Rhodospirillales bacterium]|nr:type II toxin-antitoxin system VapC family toxin [Rhodospirillales bacterium]